MISINGRKERKLTKYENIASASLSRKGFRLAYLRSWVMGTDDIFLIPNYMKMVSLKQKISVTLNHMYHSHPIFSSDGETIFYTESDAILTPASVLSKHIPTSKVTIINKSGQSEDICAISDDDTKLLMTQYYFLSKSTESDLFIIDIKNKKEHKLTENSRSNYSGIFTANDEKIIFVSNRSGQEELYMININGTNEKRLTSIGACNPCA
jgi:Tol biopolymer transport system component